METKSASMRLGEEKKPLKLNLAYSVRCTIAWRTERTEQSRRLYVLLTQRACSMREEKKGGKGGGRDS